jgi:hypothetical protein
MIFDAAPTVSFRRRYLFYLLTVGVEGVLFSRDHTQTHTTVGMNPLDEGSAPSRDLYLTTQTLTRDKHPFPPAGFEPTIPASARPKAYAIDRAATGIAAVLTVEFIFG